MKRRLLHGALFWASVLVLHLAGGAAWGVPTTITDPLYSKPVISPAAQPKFVNALPNYLAPTRVYTPDTTAYPGFDFYSISMIRFTQSVGLRDDTAPATDLPVTVYGYGDTRETLDANGQPTGTDANGLPVPGFHSYPGPTFVTNSTLDTTYPGKKVKVRWLNQIPDGPHILPVDTTLMGGPNAPNCRPFNRVIPHVHGGHNLDYSDGTPEQWFTPNYSLVGTTFWTPPNEPTGTFTYPLDQPSATLWYHDHATGITRLNVGAGLNGIFLLRDDVELALMNQNPPVLPSYPYEIPLQVHDRTFIWDAAANNGQGGAALGQPDAPVLDLTAPPPCDPVTGANCPVVLDPVTGQPIPSIQPEFFGNIIMVNGRVWPYSSVEPRKYRLRILNSSDSRTFFFSFENRGANPLVAGTPVPFLIIGADGGLFPTAVGPVTRVDVQPAERYDVILDLSGIAPDPVNPVHVVMVNTGPDGPYSPGAVPPIPVADPTTTGLIADFRVDTALSAVPDAAITATTPLQNPPANFTPTAPPRTIVMKETADQYGRIMLLLNGKGFLDPTTDLPALGSTEQWEFVNLTPDVHPMHIHLVQFRVVNRENLSQPAVQTVPPTWTLLGTFAPVKPEESIYKDTVQSFPNQVTRVVMQFDLPGLFLFHCHILSHEEHDKMRHYAVMTRPIGVIVSSTTPGFTQTVDAVSPVTFFFQGRTGVAASPTSGAYEFRLWIKDPVTGWYIARPYAMNFSYTWTPPAGIGKYLMQVDARRIGSTVNREASTSFVYTVTPALRPRSVTLTSDIPSPLVLGNAATVTFTASASPASTTYEYRFWVRDPGTGWTLAQDYSTSSTFQWSPPAATGNYFIQVDVRAPGSVSSRDASKTVLFRIIGAVPTSVTATVDPPSPQPLTTVGTTGVTFTAAGNDSGIYEYRFWIRDPGSGWRVLQSYSTSNTAVWYPTATGNYRYQVDIRSIGGNSRSAMTSGTYTVQ